MFYSPLAEFIASQTKKASMPILQETRPEIRRKLVRLDLDLMRDEAFERVLDAPSSYPGRLKAVVGANATPAWGHRDRRSLEKFVQSKQATLLVLGVHCISPWWKSLCDDVEIRLGMGSMAVGVKTPAKKPGLLVHWDMGAVTATQLAGAKKWYLWPPVVGLDEVCNLREVTPAEKKTKPAMTVTLGPGDVLFVPRGWLHRAEAQGGEPSLHVSVGIIHPDMRGRKLAAFT